MFPIPTPEQIEQTFARKETHDEELEDLNRSLACTSLIHFITYTYPQYDPEPFHVQLCENLEAVVRGDITRLMVIAPPQHGKSEAISVRLPAYWIAKKPNNPIILCSYGATLAWEKAASTWDIVYSDDYIHMFPHLFKEAPKARRGGRRIVLKYPNSKIYPAGVRGAITGRGGLLGIIDDPVKDWRDAYSPTVRESTWEWWRGTFRSRIWANGRIIIVMTRWHEDDLAGRILNTAGEKWTVVRYPAIAESDSERKENHKRYHGTAVDIYPGDPIGRAEGHPLCPRKFPLDSLLDIKADIGSRAWYAEYQGTPRPMEGNMFKIQWIGDNFRDECPREARFVRYWDKAGTADGGARTTGVLMCKTKEGLYFVVDVVSGQWSALEREQMIKATAILDREKYGESLQIYLETEPGSGGLESTQRSIINLAGFNVRGDRPTTAKPIRFEPFCVQAEAGNVFIIKGKWNQLYLEELSMFPNGTFKDQADATSGAFNKLTTLSWTRTIV